MASRIRPVHSSSCSRKPALHLTIRSIFQFVTLLAQDHELVISTGGLAGRAARPKESAGRLVGLPLWLITSIAADRTGSAEPEIVGTGEAHAHESRCRDFARCCPKIPIFCRAANTQGRSFLASGVGQLGRL